MGIWEYLFTDIDEDWPATEELLFTIPIAPPVSIGALNFVSWICWLPVIVSCYSLQLNGNSLSNFAFFENRLTILSWSPTLWRGTAFLYFCWRFWSWESKLQPCRLYLAKDGYDWCFDLQQAPALGNLSLLLKITRALQIPALAIFTETISQLGSTHYTTGQPMDKINGLAKRSSRIEPEWGSRLTINPQLLQLTSHRWCPSSSLIVQRDKHFCFCAPVIHPVTREHITNYMKLKII